MSVVHVPAAPAAALHLSAVTKQFGRNKALDRLTFSVPAGSICGLVGENGAGKTTCLSIIGGFLRADAGVIDVLGMGPFDVARHRGRVGILPQDAELPEESTPEALLRTWGRLQGMGKAAAEHAAKQAIDEVQLADRARSLVKALSHGMRRRLTVASALLGTPELILLDEPTAGLDPAQARHLRQVLAARRGTATVVISSHNLPELEHLCDHVIVIEKGRCVGNDPMSAVTGRDREVTICLAPPFPAGRAGQVQLRLLATDPADLADETSKLLAQLIAEGARIIEVRRGSALEEKYFGEGGLADLTGME